MRYLIVLLLSGCSYNLTLLPRGGGETAYGTGNSSTETIEVVLKGKTYRGRYILTGDFSNQYTSVMRSTNKTLRCEFTATSSGGNGVCVDSSNTTYDLLIEPK